MKRLIGPLLVCLGLGITSASANYIDVQDVYEYSVGGVISWSHDYDFSETPPLTATLTIVADDVDGPGNGLNGEQDEVWIRVGATGTWNYLGLLEDMGFYSNFNYYPGQGNPNQPLTTTVFDLDPSWLAATLPIEVRVESTWGVEIETSTLEVAGVSSVPETGSTLFMLGCALLGFVGLKRQLA